MGVIFIAGSYGVGKSTIIKELSRLTSFPCFSASSLIAETNAEIYGNNKFVTDKYKNQTILKAKIKEKLTEYSHILLDGHFCILKHDNTPDPLPLDVLGQMYFEKILLLDAEPNIILKNLSNRDDKKYTLENIIELLNEESKQAKMFADINKVPLYVHKMSFDGTDASKLFSLL